MGRRWPLPATGALVGLLGAAAGLAQAPSPLTLRTKIELPDVRGRIELGLRRVEIEEATQEKEGAMANTRKVLAKTVGNALSGKGSHVAGRSLFDGLDWQAAGVRPRGAPHSVYQVLNHMSYWQDWVVRWLDGETPPIPRHASGGWPGRQGATDSKEWRRAVRGFRSGLAKLERQSREADLLAARGRHTRLGMLQALASHNSYHLGQVVVLRQMLGSWPPPSGGLTW